MIELLQGLGYGIIALAVLVGIGIVMLATFSSTLANCATGYTYNSTVGQCNNGTANFDTASSATKNMYVMGNTYLGTNLVSWVPIIIVMVIGMAFLGYFIARKGKKA